MKKPIPFDETKDPDIFWKPEGFDKYLPKTPGFVTDYVYATRGIQAPTQFHTWASLVAMASALKREAWIDWYPNKLFSNLYVILVGDAGIMKKSTSIDRVEDILIQLEDHIENENMKKIKNLKIMNGSATPQAVVKNIAVNPLKSYKLQNPDGSYILNSEGKPIEYKETSEITFIISELSSFLGKQTYNEGLVPLLLKLYDCKNRDSADTATKGKITIRNSCTNFIAATTRSSIEDSIPKSLLGDGFISRVILVYEPHPFRRYAWPRKPAHAPTFEELSKRLAWIAENCTGNYKLSKEAEEAHDEWYINTHYEHLLENQKLRGIYGRRDTQVLKVAFLLHIQSYTTEKTIPIERLYEARSLLDATLKNSELILFDIETEGFTSRVNSIAKRIESRGRIDRRTLLQNSHMQTDELTRCLCRLVELGKIRVISQGIATEFISKRQDELYIWKKTDD